MEERQITWKASEAETSGVFWDVDDRQEGRRAGKRAKEGH